MRPALYNPIALDLSDPVFHDESKARAWIEAQRWPDGPVCPLCQRAAATSSLGGESMGEGWYHCRDCRRKFTVRIGTVYERSHVPLHKWLRATRLMSMGGRRETTVDRLCFRLDVSYKTAWSMRRRIRDSLYPAET